jgi:hypothetical protein
MRAAGETETTQEDIQDWLQLEGGEPGFQLLAEQEIAAVIFFICSHQYYICLILGVCILRKLYIFCLKMVIRPKHVAV